MTVILIHCVSAMHLKIINLKVYPMLKDSTVLYSLYSVISGTGKPGSLILILMVVSCSQPVLHYIAVVPCNSIFFGSTR